MEVKKCRDCHATLPATEEYFYKQKKKSKSKGEYYDLSIYCRECLCRRSRKYREDNLESVKEYEKRKYQERKDYYKENNRRYYIEKGDKKRALARKWQKTEHGKDKIKQYRKSRARKKHSISEEEWIKCKKYFEYSCAYCGISEEEHVSKFNQRLHKDHLYHEGRNDIKNCVPSCRSCNTSKGTYTLNQWYNSLNNSNYTYERYYKIYTWIRYDARNILK